VTLTAEAVEAMQTYEWPGNVRELERVIEGAVTLAGPDGITLAHLPAALTGDCAEILLPSVRRGDSMREWGSRYARLVLERCGSNKRKACRVLDISYHTLRAYLDWRPDREAAAAPEEESLARVEPEVVEPLPEPAE
jgi:DNA-binding NtrC family response regulator